MIPASTTAVPAPAPLSIPIFRAVWLASMVSNFGSLIQGVGASWTMASLAGSPQLVALVQASTTLPIMLLSLLAGAVADNLDRRKVMLAAQVFMLVVSFGLSICAWSGVLSPVLLLCFTFLIGCGTAFNGPAWQASVGEMVPRPALAGAVALNSMGFNIARSAGPAIGGAIVAAAGAAAAFAVNAVSYIGLIAVLSRWHPLRAPNPLPGEPLLQAMGSGVRYVAMSPNLRLVLLRALAFGLGAAAVPALMPLVARDLMRGGPLTYGLLLGAFGLGAVGGALLSQRLRRHLSSEGLVRVASLAMAVGAAGTGLGGTLPIVLPSLLLAGAGWVSALSTFNVTIQLATPRWVVARALSLYQMAAFGGMAGGSWLFGTIAEYHGVAEALLIAAGVQLAGIGLGWLLPLAEPDMLDLDPLHLRAEPSTSVPVEPRSGPIVVTIQYRIRTVDTVAFLQAMNERKRIRRRDGAHRWNLLRDLGDEMLWTERYDVATWLDYLRHIERRTKADVGSFDAVRALHQGPDGPRIHRLIERQTNMLPVPRTADPRELAEPMTDPNRSS